MPWKKASPEVISLMDAATASLPCRRKLMFGGVAYFANDNMFAGVHQDSPFLRLSEPDRGEVLSTWDEASLFEPMEGRPMREYVILPEGLYEDALALREWVGRGFAYAVSLPPGGEKKRKGPK